ncbi:hypothetical protein F5884DRAFT_862339 [Xylogone sp. PMI_703]|nr:hypothetical protein F5884DRAFT_862339 [Xylogone sp. PMI_703]
MGFRKRGGHSIFLALLLLPLAKALSLANFQEITSSGVSLACQLAYDAQIPTCQVSDFKGGCSRGCEEALLGIANFVSLACVGTSASSKTLLGIVQRGGILQALCSASQQTTTTTTSAMETTTTSTQQVTSETSTTMMTTSSTSIVVTTTTRVTSTTSSTPLTSTTTSSQASTTSTTPITSSTTTSSTQSASDSVDVGGGATSAETSSTSTSTSAKPSKTSSSQTQSNQNGGQGDPFDFVASDSGAERLLTSFKTTSMMLVVLAAMLLVW